MGVVVETYRKHCPKCGEKMGYIEEKCGCKYWLCPNCGNIIREKTCRMHLAEMLK